MQAKAQRDGPTRGPLARFSLVVLGTAVPCLLAILCITAGLAMGATSVTARTPAKYSVTHVGAPTAPPVTETALGDVLANAFLAGLTAGGTQTAGLIGLVGTPLALPACATAACRDRYIVANPIGLVVGDYAERATFTVKQPVTTTGTSTGFLVEVVVHMSTGWVFGRAYLATGTTATAGGATITLFLYTNLGVVAAPTILSAYAVVDECSSAAVCP